MSAFAQKDGDYRRSWPQPKGGVRFGRQHTTHRKVRWGRIVVCFVVFVSMLLAIYLTPAFQRKLYPLQYGDYIVEYAITAKIEPSLAASVICAESGYKINSVSDVGALGLMQLMPETAHWIAELYQVPMDKDADLLNPQINIRLGTLYLGWLSQRFGNNKVAALAAYNVGQHKVDEWLEKGQGNLLLEDIPYAETRHFVRRVLRNQVIYLDLYPVLKVSSSDELQHALSCSP